MPRAAANRLTAPIARKSVPNQEPTLSSSTSLSRAMKSKPLESGKSGFWNTVE
jgi:hypothetical protein